MEILPHSHLNAREQRGTRKHGGGRTCPGNLRRPRPISRGVSISRGHGGPGDMRAYLLAVSASFHLCTSSGFASSSSSSFVASRNCSQPYRNPGRLPCHACVWRAPLQRGNPRAFWCSIASAMVGAEACLFFFCLFFLLTVCRASGIGDALCGAEAFASVERFSDSVSSCVRSTGCPCFGVSSPCLVGATCIGARSEGLGRDCRRVNG